MIGFGQILEIIGRNRIFTESIENDRNRTETEYSVVHYGSLKSLISQPLMFFIRVPYTQPKAGSDESCAKKPKAS